MKRPVDAMIQANVGRSMDGGMQADIWGPVELALRVGRTRSQGRWNSLSGPVELALRAGGY